MYISPSNSKWPTLFWPYQAKHQANRRDVETPANSQLTLGYRYCFPKNLESMSHEFVGAPSGGKFKDAGSRCSQQAGLNCSVDADLSEHLNQGRFFVKHTYPKITGGLSYRHSSLETGDAHSFTSETEKQPRNMLMVNAIENNDDGSRLKSKYRHGKRFVQRLLGVLRCDSHGEKILNDRSDEQQPVTEGLCNAELFHHPNSVNESGDGRYQSVNLDSKRSE